MRTIRPYILSTFALKRLRRRKINYVILSFVVLVYYFTGVGEKISVDKFLFWVILIMGALIFYLFYNKKMPGKGKLKTDKIFDDVYSHGSDHNREGYYNTSIDLSLESSKYYNSGNAYYKRGDYDRAIEDYSKAIELDPKYAAAYNARGLAYVNKGDYDRAIEDYNKAVELEPKYANAYYNRGWAYYNKGNYYRAIADYTKAIELDSKYANAYYNRGLAYRALGKESKAQRNFEMYKKLKGK